MIEQTFMFGPEAHLVGTLTLPAQPRPGRERVLGLLSNAGVIPRIGPHRMNVRLARRLAQRGIATLRFDMSGLGDSRRSSSRRSTGEQFVHDTRCAMDLAQTKFAFDQFFMVGFCSGGDIAHVTALEDNRLRAIVMWDSYVYPTRQAKLRGFLHRLSGLTLRSAAAKVARRVASKIARSSTAGPAQPAEPPTIFGRTVMPAKDDFGQRIRTLVDRGVELLFLFSGSAPTYYNYERQFNDMYASYGFVDRVGYEFHTRSDHTITEPHAQQAVVDSVERWLETRVLTGPASRSGTRETLASGSGALLPA